MSLFFLTGILEHHECWRSHKCGKCSETSSKSYLAFTGWVFWIHVSKSWLFSPLLFIINSRRTIYNILTLWNNRYSFSTNLHIRNMRVVCVGADNSGWKNDDKFLYIFSWISPASQCATRIESTAQNWRRSSAQIAVRTTEELWRKSTQIVINLIPSRLLPVPPCSVTILRMMQMKKRCLAVLI